MLQRQLGRMQREAREQGFLVGAALVAVFEIRQQQFDFRIAVKRIVQDRRTRSREVDP